MRNKFGYYILISFLFIFFLYSCGQKENYVKCEGMIWNTLYHITYKGPETLQDSILPVLNEVGKSLSVFDKTSLVSRLNESDSIMIDSHFKIVYDESRRINCLSQGVFDPTVSPLVEAWGFGVRHKPQSDTVAIDSILEFVGINKTRREGEWIIKDDIRTQFNFSAIAKGYGCDALGEMFKRNGVRDYMIEIGGELSLRGHSPAGGDWRIGIDAPLDNIDPGKETAIVISLTDAGVATSGNYRNFRMDGDKRVAHTISPVSGRPYLSEILSATVIAKSCMEADAIATACMAGTFAEAKHLLETTETEGMMILNDSIYFTPSFKKYLK